MFQVLLYSKSKKNITKTFCYEHVPIRPTETFVKRTERVRERERERERTTAFELVAITWLSTCFIIVYEKCI